jgi:hypothetical protein
LWLLTRKTNHKSLKHTGFHFGEIVAPPAKVRDNTSALQIDFEGYDWNQFKKDAADFRFILDKAVIVYGKKDLTR